ncbi:MAG: thioredoxin domain-containing protein [Telmatospirillum sp.]|nr:thioredoxin domain-containing protein [Telmatospirillum sp.]
MSRNQLDQETSPYLLQHSTNPVHWRPWGAAALAEAKAANKPILLSVGYAACHWCHVMAHESFEDETTAQLINALFVPIKVDREERPDLDIIYQSALASLGQQGGWPLTMFLTADAEPFWGGTYFPPSPRFGRPSFRDVLTGVAATYTAEPDKISTNVAALQQALLRLATPERGSIPDRAIFEQIATAVLPAVDLVHGGLSGAPKFPQVPMFQLLWKAGLRRADPALREAVTNTLTHMCQGGIYDHLGGGFARYATDESWLVPHFEKMLYDNAQLIELLTSVWQHDASPLYAARITETIDWLLRNMLTDHGAFAATLDADSEGVEGKYYVWSSEEIDRVLPADQASLLKSVYGVTTGGNWEGHSILNRNHRDSDADSDDALAARLIGAKRTLLAVRSKRIPPARDDKCLADWNGMMIAALANAAFVFRRADWQAAAEKAFAAIRDHQSIDDRLVHSMRRGRRQGEAMLDDYAQMARAALVLYATTGQQSYLSQASRWVNVVDRHFRDDLNGGCFFTADNAPDLIIRTKSAFDQATPSGNGVMVDVLARLFYQTGDDLYRQRAEAIVSAFAGQIERSFPSMASLLNSWELLNDAVHVVVVAASGDPAGQTLLTAIAESCQPNLVMTRLSPDDRLPDDHPAAAKLASKIAGAVAFVCRGPVCSAPIIDPAALHLALTES